MPHGGSGDPQDENREVVHAPPSRVSRACTIAAVLCGSVTVTPRTANATHGSCSAGARIAGGSDARMSDTSLATSDTSVETAPHAVAGTFDEMPEMMAHGTALPATAPTSAITLPAIARPAGVQPVPHVKA